jgi:hypothetical protein
MRWTEQETARLAYLVDKFLKEGYHVSDACEKAAPLMQRTYNSCHSRYNYKVRYVENDYIQKYHEYAKEHQNKNYTIFVNDKEADIVVSEPSIIVAKDGDTIITIKIKA